MPRKKHKPEEIVAQLWQVDVMTAQGVPQGEAIRRIGASEVTCDRWRKEYGGMGADRLKRQAALLDMRGGVA